MKATIEGLGTLVIIAENDIESYALKKWMEDYWNFCEGGLKSDSKNKLK